VKLATFEHPAKVYRLEYPAHWEHLVQDEGRSCGFGPRERDDVGLWISILPLRADTETLQADLGRLFAEALEESAWTHLHQDPSLRHFGLKADCTAPDNGGHYWLVAGGDVVLFASSQVPRAEQEQWRQPLDRVMGSLEITRGDELFALKVTNALLARLQARFPGRDFVRETGRIRSEDWLISSGNLVRRVRLAPDRQAEVIEAFIDGLQATGDDAPAAEELAAVRELILPVLKPASYVASGGPAAEAVHHPWLADVIICYAIRGARTLRLILEGDLARWRLDRGTLRELALVNLQGLVMPERLRAASPSSERVVVLSAQDHFEAARLLDPRLHDRLAPAVGSPFWAAVPDRDTLLVFPSGDQTFFARMSGTIRAQYERAAYPVSPDVFVVSRRGVSLPTESQP
jgi:uncharacterized protein YtpQ (UPF0354 family)